MKRVILVLVTLLLLVSGVFLTWLTTTESGLRWAYRTLAPGLPAGLRVAEVSGVAAGPLVLRGVNYSYQGTVLSALRVELDWNPWSLLLGEFELERLQAESLRIELAESEPGESPPLTLPFAFNLQNVRVDGFEFVSGTSVYPAQAIDLNARLNADEIVIEQLEIVAQGLRIGVSGTLNLSAGYPHRLAFDWDAALPSGAPLDAAGRIDGDLAATRLTQRVTGAGLELEQSLELRDLRGAPSWQTTLVIAEFDTRRLDPSLPPLRGSLRAEAAGDLSSARADGRIEAESAQTGPFEASFSLRSRAGEDLYHGLHVDELKLRALDGELTASGQLDWLPALRWRAEAVASAVNPGRLLPDWPGALDARFSSQGGLDDDRLEAKLDIDQLRGTLRDYPLAAAGNLSWRDQGIDIDALRLDSGNTRIEARGRVAERLELDWSLRSDDLAELYPGAGGSLDARGTLAGARETPRIQASVKGKSLAWSDYAAGEVSAEVAIDSAEPTQLDIDLSAAALRLGGQHLHTLEIDAGAGRIVARAVAAEASATVELEGRFDDRRWRGKLLAASVQSKNYSTWKLTAPGAILVARDALSVARLCLQNSLNASVCGAVDGQQAQWNIDLEGARVPLPLLAPLLPAALGAEGLADASARLVYREPRQLLGKIDLELAPGSARYRTADERRLQLEYRSGRLNLLLDASGIDASAELDRANGDRVQASARLPGASLLTLRAEGQPLQAQLSLAARDLSIADALLDEVDKLSGELQLTASIGGTLALPRASGELRLAGAELYLPRLDVTLRQLQIAARSDDGSELGYQVTAMLGDGSLAASGNTMNDPGGGWPSKIRFDGEGIEISPLARLWLPAAFGAEGLADASGELDYRGARQLLGKIEVELAPGSARYRTADERRLQLEYRSGKLNLLLDASGIDASAELDRANGDRVQASARLPGASLLTLRAEGQPLQAQLSLAARDLSIADALLDEVDKLSGELQLTASIGGTLALPRASGELRLAGAALHLPRFDISLRQLQIAARSDDGSELGYQATALLGDGSLAASGNTVIDPGGGWPSNIRFDARNIEILPLARRWLPAEISLQGRADARANLDFRAPNRLRGEITVDLPAGALDYPLLEGEIESWRYRDGKLLLALEDSGIRGNAEILLGDDNRLDARLSLPGASALALDPQTQTFEASAGFRFKELGMIAALVPEIDKPRGDLDLNLGARGTLGQPVLQLQARIDDAAVDIPRLGLQISRISLSGSSDETGRFNFKLGASSGEGQLELEGNSQLDAAAGWPTRVRIRGENFEVSRIPEAVVNLSPDLSVELRHRSVDIRGDLRIPYARLQPRDITTAARVSDDVVIIGGDQAAEQKWRITSRINVILGDRVSFFGYGFEGQLGGSLLIEDQPGQPTSGSGEITIPKGRYRAYGQHLDVENGRLLFSGGPLNNPGLDLRATRTTNGVVAGLLVRGNLRKPQVDLFSVPAMGETDTLSYLMFGRPMETASDSDGELMAQAALALGLSGGDRLARSIGDRFGFDEMRIESSSSGDQASLVVGRYLSPQLYVSYGVGLLEAINSLNLRYQITEKWKLEAESGAHHGADFLYTIER